MHITRTDEHGRAVCADKQQRARTDTRDMRIMFARACGVRVRMCLMMSVT